MTQPISSANKVKATQETFEGKSLCGDVCIHQILLSILYDNTYNIGKFSVILNKDVYM